MTNTSCKASAMRCLNERWLPAERLFEIWGYLKDRYDHTSYGLFIEIQSCQDDARLDRFVQDVTAESLNNELNAKWYDAQNTGKARN